MPEFQMTSDHMTWHIRKLHSEWQNLKKHINRKPTRPTRQCSSITWMNCLMLFMWLYVPTKIKEDRLFLEARREKGRSGTVVGVAWSCSLSQRKACVKVRDWWNHWANHLAVNSCSCYNAQIWSPVTATFHQHQKMMLDHWLNPHLDRGFETIVTHECLTAQKDEFMVPLRTSRPASILDSDVNLLCPNSSSSPVFKFVIPTSQTSSYCMRRQASMHANKDRTAASQQH